jgi:hypothetical protein
MRPPKAFETLWLDPSPKYQIMYDKYMGALDLLWQDFGGRLKKHLVNTQLWKDLVGYDFDAETEVSMFRCKPSIPSMSGTNRLISAK